MITLRTAALAASACLVGAASAVDGTQTVSASIPYTGLNWTQNLVVPQFNGPGHLDSVEISFHGAAKGSMQFENRDIEETQYSASLSYLLVLKNASGGTLLSVSPSPVYSVSGDLTAFDGQLDYDGTSGITYPERVADDSGTVTITSPDDVAAFVGTGTASLPVDASSNSHVSGSGNFDKVIRNSAAADITITYHYSYELGSIGDRVWFDANANGKQDDGEHGIAGLTIKLLDGSNNVVATDTTDSDGNYLFDNLAPGSYTVQFSKPTGYDYTVADAGTDDDIDSDADGSGRSPVIVLGAGEDRLDVDAGLLGTLCLGDRVWKDLDKDGLQDNCEPGVAGVAVHLLDKDGNVLADTVTDKNGYYKFTNLAPGDYGVDFDAPAGYGFTKQFADSRYKQYDSNVDVNTGVATVTLASNDSTIDAGLIGALKIGDTVWLDSDGDGKYEPEVGEKGIKGVRVYMIGDTNGDGRADVSASTVTDADGHYQFIGLTPGTYQVSLNSYDLPNGVRATYDLDGVGTKNVATAKLLPNQDNLDFDFGYKPGSTCGTGTHTWWGCNPTKWFCDKVWIGGKCHSRTTACSWLKKSDCGDKSICVYQRLCAAKLNVGNGCNEGTVYSCGRVTCSVKEAIKRCDDWMSRNPVGCKVSGNSSSWSSVCDYYGILDKFCGR
jgi:protocatechuate 3,4-dioxygenase beta subunit